MKCDQKLVKSVQPLMNISTKLVLKCAESVWSIRGHEMTEIVCDQKSMRSVDPTN